MNVTRRTWFAAMAAAVAVRKPLNKLAIGARDGALTPAGMRLMHAHYGLGFTVTDAQLAGDPLADVMRELACAARLRQEREIAKALGA